MIVKVWVVWGFGWLGWLGFFNTNCTQKFLVEGIFNELHLMRDMIMHVISRQYTNNIFCLTV